jgi:microcystin-dependent protein
MPILDFPPSPSVGQIYENETSGTYRWNGYAWDRVNAYVVPIGIPDGGIIMWSGSIATIPASFKLCDGTNGTPDLRDRFIVGAGSSFAPLATGGTKDAVVVSHTHGMGAHTHPVNDPGHRHIVRNENQGQVDSTLKTDRGNGSLAYTTYSDSATTGITIGAATGDTSSAGEDGTNKNLPPFFALAFIMKVAA